MPTSVPKLDPTSAPDIAPSHTRHLWPLVLGSIGIVYGDIGTSPIYAFREAMLAATEHGAAVAEATVLGILSLIFWALILVVTLKYVVILVRADNNGEGGTLALMALAQRAFGGPRIYIVLLGVIATALFYGNAVLTPALSVLSAVEGGAVAWPALEGLVLPIAVVILLLLFYVQSRGTAGVALLFGPITCVWFLVIALLGFAQVLSNPEVLAAINPLYGAEFLIEHGFVSLLTLGAVFLAVTGGEALYADLGHFGRRPIQIAWFGLVLPSLVLTYFGQGALLLRHPEAVTNPFFLMAPGWGQLPLAVLATAATAIASQAVITGAYSLTQQAIQLGLLPRMEIRHTSGLRFGQIYIPRVNTFLLVGVLLLVGIFQTSSALAGAYGIAVSGTMVVTAVLAILVVWKSWKWSLAAALALMIPFRPHRFHIPGCEPPQDPERRMVFRRARGLADACDADVATGHGDPFREDAASGNSAAHSGRQARSAPATAGRWHSHLSHERSDQRPDSAPSQPQALQGASRQQCDPDGSHGRYAAGRPRRSRDHGLGFEKFCPNDRPIRLHGEPKFAESARRREKAGLDI